MLKFILAIMLMFPSLCFASPFLVCDPYPASVGVTQFAITIDGTLVTVNAKVAADGSTSIYYDCASLSTGTHTITAKAISLWGESASSSPFVFTRPASLTAPAGTGLIK